MERKGFGPRLGALLIDLVILLLVGCGIALATGGAYFQYGSPSAEALAQGRTSGIISGIAFLLYASTEIFAAATPGKMILRQLIGSAAGTAPAPTGALVTRYLVKWSPTILNLLFWITMLGAISFLAGLARGGAGHRLLLHARCETASVPRHDRKDRCVRGGSGDDPSLDPKRLTAAATRSIVVEGMPYRSRSVGAFVHTEQFRYLEQQRTFAGAIANHVRFCGCSRL